MRRRLIHNRRYFFPTGISQDGIQCASIDTPLDTLSERMSKFGRSPADIDVLPGNIKEAKGAVNLQVLVPSMCIYAHIYIYISTRGNTSRAELGQHLGIRYMLPFIYIR